ncbi:DEAD/DEAH box helicase domain protein [Ammonifex degensii KC4]|uniref:DEAD/DEAH box helicase domain protein n=1 Tax=Ammonifex degensii (strain DSM 10501 / KC4) TaxID=429009 RepID=C9R987_AMMDK|nr:DEAD/DEAH box helicase [Ammonifex degensii]ACX52866.1 DEAD/DEAH box helicase domain protein [Ammonifex degensii KC4]
MPLSVIVTNQPPEIDKNVPEPVMELFQAYTRAKCGKTHLPFCHQAEVFRRVLNDQEVFLLAGTAAGKTLAIAVPLFYKLREGRIWKILLMYPTIALMEDQRRVMDTMAQITGLQIGQLQGGMSRTELMAALNKPVILATPDEIYWFFRKNVKYNGLLIYGLALVDEFVLDEAHLFNGLMLRNLMHLKQRVCLLGEKLGKRPRWHVLTATPTPELRNFTGGVEVWGRSKCSDVEVKFLDPVRDYEERQNTLTSSVEAALADGAQKVLLVLNSADMAHRIFEDIKGKFQPDLPIDLQWRFGRVRWGRFKGWLEKKKIAAETIKEIEDWLKREGPFYLKDLSDGCQVNLPVELVVARVAHILESQAWALRRLLYTLDRERKRPLVTAMDQQLKGKGKLRWLLWKEIRPKLSREADVNSIVTVLETHLSLVQAGLERSWVDDSIKVTAPAFKEITEYLERAGVNRELDEIITSYLKFTIELPEQSVASLGIPPKKVSERYMALSWLEWLIRDSLRRQELVEHVYQALAAKELEVEARHISTWGETGVPVVIYTGKMSQTEREGLIDAFNRLPKAVLISTPAVEVGVDFAADVLITEQCDGNSFLQRFGRVGRRTGTKGKVFVLVRDGEVYVRLFRRHRNQMSREEFSAFIADPVDGLFPTRLYAEGSAFLDATHWMVNDQLGEIGRWLNQAMFGSEVAALGHKLKEANLPFSYGLRGTLPGISLRGGAAGGEPFYILRKVGNERLFPGDSPFEMARADVWYLEFLWEKAPWKAVVVDAKTTLEASRALFWWQGGQWHVRAGVGIAADYVKLFSDKPASRGQPVKFYLRLLEKQIKYNLEEFLSKIRLEESKPLPQLLIRVGEALPLFFESYSHFILGQGDVYLRRVDKDGISEPVEDQLGNPVVLPEQTWLIMYRYTREKAEELLRKASVLGLEEIIYDWDTLEVPGSLGPVLLDRVAGACFYVYRRLVEYADR